MFNKFNKISLALANKSFSNGLGCYTQANCQCTLTDKGYRIYRPPNVDGVTTHNTWGGLKLQPMLYDNDFLKEGNTYVILIDVDGKSSSRISSCGWKPQMGWTSYDGTDESLLPKPSNVETNITGTWFTTDTHHLLYYKFTISDKLYKTSAYTFSIFESGKTYLSYRDFAIGFGYENTGTLGTDLYLSNFRMYDITNKLDKITFNKNGIITSSSIYTGYDKLSLQKYSDISCNDISEY